MHDLLFVGAGGHAVSCIDVIEAEGRFRIACVVGTQDELNSSILSYKVTACDSDLEDLANIYEYAFIGIGHIRSSDNRKRLYQRLLDFGFKFPVVISPNAYVSKSAMLGPGSIIMNGATVNGGAVIGENSIINSNALVEHGCRVGAHAHISTGVTLNSDVVVGSGSFVGSMSVVKHGVSIGENCVVNMRSIVRKDVPGRFVGTSGKSNRDRDIFVIAEAGVNHNGSIDLAKKLVEIAAESGADAVKFQYFIADRLATLTAQKAEYQKSAGEHSENQYEMLKRLELSPAMLDELMAHAKKYRIEFMSTAFDEESVRLLAEKGLKKFKIPSGEITNRPYLETVADVADELIMSTGMASLKEIGEALGIFEKAGIPKDRITLLHCTSAYPAPINEVDLLAMSSLGDEFGVRIGYSDHTVGTEIAIAAAALGACVIEKHFTLNKMLEGPDHSASAEPQQLKLMIDGIRVVQSALGDGFKAPSVSELENLNLVRKSLVASSAILKGTLFSEADLTSKRPGTGISPMHINSVIGLPAPRDFDVDEIIEL
jgi:N,N'-diacetyllegionaminate synthase